MSIFLALLFGYSVRKFWPGGVRALLALAVIDLVVIFVMNATDPESPGEPNPDFTVGYITHLFVPAFLTHIAAFLISWYITRQVRAWRARRAQ